MACSSSPWRSGSSGSPKSSRRRPRPRRTRFRRRDSASAACFPRPRTGSAARGRVGRGARVPLRTLGLRGSATTAVMLGGLMLFGLRPGPLLFEQHPQFAWGIIASMHVSNLMLVLVNLLAIPLFVSVLRLPKAVLFPSIVALAMIGTFSLENHLFEVWLALLFSAFGYLMMKLDYPPAPLALALGLGNPP